MTDQQTDDRNELKIGSKVRWVACPDAVGEIIEMREDSARVQYGQSRIITWLRNLTVAIV